MQDTIDKYAARVLMVSFFLSPRVQVIVAVLAGLYFVARSLAGRQWPEGRSYLWAIFLGSGLLVYLAAVAFTPAALRKEVLHICERRESLLIMPLAFASISPALRMVMRGELIFFAYATFATCMATNADFLYHYMAGHDGTHPLSHILYRMYFEAICGLHPTYMSMYLVFSICVLLQTPAEAIKGAKVMKYLLLYTMPVFLLALLAKSPMIALVVILLHMAWVNRSTLYRYKAAIAGSAGVAVVAAFAIPFFRQRMAELLHLFDKKDAANAEFNSVYVRKLIWEFETSVARQYFWTGVGPGRVLRALQEHFFFFSLSHSFNVGYYDPHSEYFTELLSFGICGLLLLVAILAVQFVKAIKVRDHLYLYLLLTFAITFVTETVLSRQQGVIFYAVFTSLFFFTALNNGKERQVMP